MYAAEHKTLFTELLEKAEAKTAALDPLLLKALLFGGGVAAGAVPTALVLRHQAEQEQARTRNRAFGAGMAAGVAAPHVLRGLAGAAQRAGLLGQQPLLMPGGLG